MAGTRMPIEDPPCRGPGRDGKAAQRRRPQPSSSRRAAAGRPLPRRGGLGWRKGGRGHAAWLAVAAGLGLLACIATAPPAATAEAADGTAAKPPSPAVLRFDRFIAASGPVCLAAPARHCVDAAWRFADADRNGTLSLAELARVRAALQDWTAWKGPGLSNRERSAIAIGLFVVDAIGLEKLFAGFNTAGDGKLRRSELLANVRLDDRPLGQVLLDPEAVDRAALAKRLGKFAPVVGAMMQPPAAPPPPPPDPPQATR